MGIYQTIYNNKIQQEGLIQSPGGITSELIWLKSLLTGLDIYLEIVPLSYILAANLVFHACTKHKEIDYSFFREKNTKLKVKFVAFEV